MKKDSFSKLTEELDNLANTETEEVVKSEEPVVAPVEEPVVEEPAKEEDKEEKVEEVVEPNIPEVVPQAEEVPVVAPEAPEEEVEKSQDSKAKADEKDGKKKTEKDGKGDDDGDSDDKCPGCGKSKSDCTCDDKKVKKSADEVTEADFLGAFEAVIKSFSSIKEELAGVKSELAELKKSVVPAVASIESTEPVTEEPVAKSEEAPVEEVSKSTEEVVEPEGKAVEFIAKSEDGVTVEEAVVENEEPAPFVASEHVDTVMDYFMKHAHDMSPGKQVAIRQAVSRVKRGEGSSVDANLFQEIVNFNQN